MLALMSAELSLMMEQNGGTPATRPIFRLLGVYFILLLFLGNILWVRRAFGDFMAWMNAYNYLAYSFASLALGYILFVDYLVLPLSLSLSLSLSLFLSLSLVRLIIIL